MNVLWEEGSHKNNVRSFLGELNEILLGRKFSVFSDESIDRLIGALRERGNSNATINRKMAALSKLLRKAEKMGDIRSLPEFRRQREKAGRIRILDADEEARLFAAIRARSEDAWRLSVFLVDAGCRLGEALGLMWQDIADDRATFWITKSGRSRTAPLTARARNAIDAPKNGGSGSVRQSDATGFPRRLERRQGGNRAFGRHAGGAAYPAPHLRLAAGARRDRHSPGADVARPPDAVDDHALRASGHRRSRRLRKSAGTRGLTSAVRAGC